MICFTDDLIYSLNADSGGTLSQRYRPDLCHLQYSASYFNKAPDLNKDPNCKTTFDKLAQAMCRTTIAPECANSAIPPVFTYFAQFIDHDLCACIAPGQSSDGSRKFKAPDALFNLRTGSLNLASVYGNDPLMGQSGFDISRYFQDPENRALLRLGSMSKNAKSSDQKTGAHAYDIPRLHDLLCHNDLTLQELNKFPDRVRHHFIHPDGAIIHHKAIIGDTRNDAALALSQFHLSWMMLHNTIAQHAQSQHKATQRGQDDLFRWTQRQTRWIYQWLIINAFLPAVCDPDMLAKIRVRGPRIYREFFKTNKPSNPHQLPLPLEFCLAAFKFSPSMTRTEYDWNSNFGYGSQHATQNHASVEDLFDFPGNEKNAMRFSNGKMAPSLPEKWAIDWMRFVQVPIQTLPHRSAYKIDTHMGVHRQGMEQETTRLHNARYRSTRRLLQLGHQFDLPSSQRCVASLRQAHDLQIPCLNPAEIASGENGLKVCAGDFDQVTPLWFYILKEAETQASGQHLGALGTLLVAETLYGLLEHDPTSYFNSALKGRNWRPADSICPNGIEILDMQSMMQAAGALN